MIAIVDYGLGNLGSIQNMLKRIGRESIITSIPAEIEAAEKIILPGVGKFDAGIMGLHERNLVPTLYYKAFEENTPILGICLGMQLLMEGSDEGNKAGLGWIKGRVHRFKADSNMKVPHMGWNKVNIQNESALTKELSFPPKFYFVHSYYVKTENEDDTFLTTEYGVTFASGIQHGNICGVQFHPEKSHKYGMKLLNNFVEL